MCTAIILQNVVEGEEEEEVLVRGEAAHPLTDEHPGKVEPVPCGEPEKTDLCVDAESVTPSGARRKQGHSIRSCLRGRCRAQGRRRASRSGGLLVAEQIRRCKGREGKDTQVEARNGAGDEFEEECRASAARRRAGENLLGKRELLVVCGIR